MSECKKEESKVVDSIHKHCLNCYSFTLCTRDSDSCEFMTCPHHECSSVFHSCKELEHYELCAQITVKCINSFYGCDAVMLRRDISSHLARCPASLVVCMAEWNRWPIFSSERLKAVSFRQKNPYAEDGQLDYDLAMRDERMLNSLGQVSRKTRLSLRNNLTRRFPAVPLPSSVMSRSTSLEAGTKPDAEDSLDIGTYNALIGVNVDSQLSKQMKRWEDDLNNRLKEKDLERPPHYWEFPELEKGNIHKHCSKCFNINCERTFAYDEPDDKRACHVTECRWNCGIKMHGCKMFEHVFICPSYEEVDDFAWMFKGVEGAKTRKTKKDQTATKLKAQASLFQGPSEPARKCLRKGIPDPPPMPKTIQKTCRLDIRLDTVTRLQTKPRAMYTFTCAQEFRRDEFQFHSKNVHNDIMGGLNNWMEHRCPMSVYGCPFSSRRMDPHDEYHILRFDKELESFGVTLKSGGVNNFDLKKKLKSHRSLLDLPMEILVQIIEQLDSFSLRNLAVTSVALRNICLSLLDSRGCVSLQWERLKVGKKEFKWAVAHKRWFFSTAMHPIEKWKMREEEKVSNHLKECPFNVINKPKDMKKSKEWKVVLKSYKEKHAAKINEL